MFPADSQPRVPRRTSRVSLAVVAVLALGCSVTDDFKPNIAVDLERNVEKGSRERVAEAPARPARARCDGIEPDLAVRWEPSLDEAMERGRREKKPVLIAFSARRQDKDFGGEF